MIFKAGWQLILAGTKTEVRVPQTDGMVLHANPKRVSVGSRTKWQVGKTYAVQPGGGKKSVGRILLLEIDQGFLEDMKLEDAHAEGFETLEAYCDGWKKRYGNYDAKQVVFILSFERVPTPSETATAVRHKNEQALRNLASAEFEKLTSVGHELSEWQPDGKLQLRNECLRCEGYVTVSVGDVHVSAHVPPMSPNVCLADYPEALEKVREDWGNRLAQAYELILGAYWRSKDK